MSNLQNIPAKFTRISSICTATEVVIGGQTVLGIADARDLHRGMNVREQYSQWIARRIKKYEFRQGVDFVSFSEKSLEPRGGAPGRVYTVTLNMAKELAMVENSTFGREARAYFLWCESELLRGKVEAPAPEPAAQAVPVPTVAQLTKALTELNRRQDIYSGEIDGLVEKLCEFQNWFRAMEIFRADVENRLASIEDICTSPSVVDERIRRRVNLLSEVVFEIAPRTVTHMTVQAFAKSRGMSISREEAQSIGWEASRRTRLLGMVKHSVPGKTGPIGAYPVEILCKLMTGKSWDRGPSRKIDELREVIYDDDIEALL